MAASSVDADDVMAGERERDGETAAADGELEDGPATIVGQLLVQLGVVADIEKVEIVVAGQARPVPRRRHWTAPVPGPPAEIAARGHCIIVRPSCHVEAR